MKNYNTYVYNNFIIKSIFFLKNFFIILYTKKKKSFLTLKNNKLFFLCYKK